MFLNLFAKFAVKSVAAQQKFVVFLLTAGILTDHLVDSREHAQELFLRLVEQYADTEGVTKALKADDPMAWVRKMNGIRHRANKAVMQEIVYG